MGEGPCTCLALGSPRPSYRRSCARVFAASFWIAPFPGWRDVLKVCLRPHVCSLCSARAARFVSHTSSDSTFATACHGTGTWIGHPGPEVSHCWRGQKCCPTLPHPPSRCLLHATGTCSHPSCHVLFPSPFHCAHGGIAHSAHAGRSRLLCFDG